MTFTDIQTLAAQLMRADVMDFAADLATGDGTTTPAADLEAQINAAYRWLALRCHLVKGDVALALTANTYRYALSGDGWNPAVVGARCLEVRQVQVGGAPLLNFARKPGMVSLDEMEAVCVASGDWMTGGTAGTVARAMQLADVLWVYPKPAANAAGTMLARILPPDLAASDDVPWLGDELHEAIAMAAAAYAGRGTASDQVVWTRIGAYDSSVQPLVEAAAARNRKMWGLDGYEESAKGED